MCLRAYVCVCALMPRRHGRLHTLLFAVYLNWWQTHLDQVESLRKCFSLLCRQTHLLNQTEIYAKNNI